VGPNGSGKSNVIDAMLFVFGKRAKKLRLNKVSELIHKSAAVMSDPPQTARVSVFFQEIVDTGEGDEDYRVVPNTDTVITRIARIDNSSSYKLNGKTCQFKEVAAYLDSKGIDLDNNRFLILQGEVEMISMMQPKGKTDSDEGLLEYLEDIIGSSKFVEETNLAAEKVEALTEQRQERLNRVKAVEKEKDALESAKLEAEALLGKEREIRRKQNVLFQINVMEANHLATKLSSKRTAACEKLAAERERLEGANQRVKEIEDGLVAQKVEYEKILKELTRTKDEFGAYERRDIKLREEMKYAKEQRKKLVAKIGLETKKLDDALKRGLAAEKSIPKIEEAIQALTGSKVLEDNKLEAIYEDMKQLTLGLRSELEQKTHELAPVIQERTVFQAALETAQTEANLLEDSSNRAKEKLVAAESELAQLDEKQHAKRAELVACEEELAKAISRIAGVEQEDKVIAEKQGQLAKRNKDLLVCRNKHGVSLMCTLLNYHF
jgi:structural maintenance of chromosome 4